MERFWNAKFFTQEGKMKSPVRFVTNGVWRLPIYRSRESTPGKPRFYVPFFDQDLCRRVKSFSSEDDAVVWAQRHIFEKPGFSKKAPPRKITLEQLERSPSAFLYLITCGEFTKIGITYNISKRARSIQAHCPYPITVAHQWSLSNCVEAERYLHRKFKGKRCHGEWFALSPEDLCWIKAWVESEIVAPTL